MLRFKDFVTAAATCCTVRDRTFPGPLTNKQRDTGASKASLSPLALSAEQERVSCRFGDKCRRANLRHWVAESHPGDPDWPVETPPELPHVVGEDYPLPREGSYDWIRQANGPKDRAQRCAIATATLKACRARGYKLGEAAPVTQLLSVDRMVTGTRLLTSRQLAARLAELGRPRSTAKVPLLAAAPEPLPLDVAVARTASGERVALVSPASAYHPCGGFRSGGRHALEESLCVQTSLAVSLQRALWLAQTQSPAMLPPDGMAGHEEDWLCYIPDDGVVLSPAVEIFRESYSRGYSFRPSTVELTAVVSVAMPNRNPGVRDAPLDAPTNEQQYRALLGAKFRAALGAARLAGATVVVMPAVGCGVYRNDPADVGRALGEALCCSEAAGNPDEGGLQEVLLVGAPPVMLTAALGEMGW